MRAVLSGLLLLVLTPLALADEAMDWLRRMDEAGDRLNYQGTLVYSYGDTLTNFRLTHVRDGNREWEHLVQLDGKANEVVRGGGELIYKAPGGTSTHLRIQPSASLRPEATAESLARIAPNYRLTATPGERIAGRDALRVAVMPVGADRYGHVFFLDKTTGLLLKSQLLDTDGSVLETLGFSSLSVGDKVGREDYQNARHAADEIHTQHPVPPHIPPRPQPARWQFWIPAGFVASPEGVRAKRMNGSRVEVITFNDGLSSVSVFSEPVTGKTPRTKQSTRGSTALVSRVINGKPEEPWLITVVGEVPLETARRIADSAVPAGTVP